MIDDILKKYLPSKKTLADTLMDSMNYSVLIGGKRIRPTLMYESYKLFGGNDKNEIEPFMCAIEMIHSYSLVHDDLPAMDNDELRRGKITTWKKYGEAEGILAGDALLTYAFETAVKSSAKPKKVLKAIKVLSNKAGLYGMCGGQAVDVELTGLAPSQNTLMFIYKNKTSALIEASLMIGAILAGASKKEVRKMEEIGSCVGLAFQIRDDILDITSSEEELGKPIGSDEDNGKKTYALINGVEKAQHEVERLSNSAIKKLDKLPGNKKFFKDFILTLQNRNS